MEAQKGKKQERERARRKRKKRWIERKKRERWKGTEIVARKLARGRDEPCEGNREAGKERWNESSGLTTSSSFFAH